MENVFLFSSDMYEVEKIINCKYYKNKKYYLIKWLCYPINQSTWEPKSNLKNLKYLIDEFEAEYPYTIDHNMYNIFCDEDKKRIPYGITEKRSTAFKQQRIKSANQRMSPALADAPYGGTPV